MPIRLKKLVGTLLLIVLVLVLCNGFFAISEMSVVTARRSKLKQMAEHSRGARDALALAEQPETFLSTVQIGITLIGVLTGVFGGEAIGQQIAAWLSGTWPEARHCSTSTFTLPMK